MEYSIYGIHPRQILNKQFSCFCDNDESFFWNDFTFFVKIYYISNPILRQNQKLSALIFKFTFVVIFSRNFLPLCHLLVVCFFLTLCRLFEWVSFSLRQLMPSLSCDSQEISFIFQNGFAPFKFVFKVLDKHNVCRLRRRYFLIFRLACNNLFFFYRG